MSKIDELKESLPDNWFSRDEVCDIIEQLRPYVELAEYVMDNYAIIVKTGDIYIENGGKLRELMKQIKEQSK